MFFILTWFVQKIILADNKCMTMIMFKKSEGSLTKKKITICRNPGLNRGHLDLQSNALPTELFRLLCVAVATTTVQE